MYALAVLVLVGCAGGSANVATAKNARYEADRAAVYQAAYDAALAKFKVVDGNPTDGTMKTSWMQIQTTEAYEGGRGGRGHLQYQSKKESFVRFDIAVVGQRPWQLTVVGHAAEREAGAAVPLELQAGETPMWLAERTDNFVIELHEQVSKRLASSH